MVNDYRTVGDAVMLLSDITLPRGFDTTDNFEEVSTPDKVRALWDATGRVRVWTGFSDHTIFDSPRINWASRAWHDWVHIMGRYPHDREGEKATLSDQLAMLRQLRLPDGEFIGRVLTCEVIGQVEYYYRTGSFADNQKEFTTQVIGR